MIMYMKGFCHKLSKDGGQEQLVKERNDGEHFLQRKLEDTQGDTHHWREVSGGSMTLNLCS